MPTARLGILLGHSHTGSLIHAVTSRGPSPERNRDRLHLAMFENFRYDGKPPYVAKDASGRDCFNPAVLAGAEPYILGLGRPRYIVSFGGNDWAVLALMRHRRPFDFILPSEPDLPLDPSAELVTYGYIRFLLKCLTDVYNYQLFLLRQATSDPIYSLVPPPPIGDDEVIERQMDDFFRRNIGFSAKVTSRHLRKKMWLLQRQLQEVVCRENQITLVDAPATAVTADGFLNPEFYGHDATHANTAYGHELIAQLQDLLDVDYHTYHWFS